MILHIRPVFLNPVGSEVFLVSVDENGVYLIRALRDIEWIKLRRTFGDQLARITKGEQLDCERRRVDQASSSAGIRETTRFIPTDAKGSPRVVSACTFGTTVDIDPTSHFGIRRCQN
jgi:hypothetical protein